MTPADVAVPTATYFPERGTVQYSRYSISSFLPTSFSSSTYYFLYKSISFQIIEEVISSFRDSEWTAWNHHGRVYRGEDLLRLWEFSSFITIIQLGCESMKWSAGSFYNFRCPADPHPQRLHSENSNPISRPIFINMPCKETTKNVQWEVVGGVFKSLRVNDLMNLRSKRSLTWVRLLSSCYWRRNHPFFLRSQRCLHLLTPTENCTEPFSFLLFFFFLEDQKRWAKTKTRCRCYNTPMLWCSIIASIFCLLFSPDGLMCWLLVLTITATTTYYRIFQCAVKYNDEVQLIAERVAFSLPIL